MIATTINGMTDINLTSSDI